MKRYKAFAKVNIFLKITGKRNVYHEMISRFMRVENLYDELFFVKKEEYGLPQERFGIIGDFCCQTEQNTIYKAYLALKKATKSDALERLMQTYALKVEKNIPAFAGLGGGSSDAASYLKMCNEVLHLGLSLNELASVGLEVGADVPFFIYDYGSANVSGIGEVVELYEEDVLEIFTRTPKIQIATPEVYRIYRENFYKPLDGFKVEQFKKMSSQEALKQMDAFEANDLFAPAVQAYPALKKEHKAGEFFSGSGSSFFRLNEKKAEE
jgi:4-diphosphocytidyl-2-C-methyl-D-erythritol kinase